MNPMSRKYKKEYAFEYRPGAALTSDFREYLHSCTSVARRRFSSTKPSPRVSVQLCNYPLKSEVNIAPGLLKIARGDIDSAIGLIQSKKGRPENIVYMCQQAIEKTIKSVICFQNLPILHTHDLEALIVMLPSNVPRFLDIYGKN